MYLFYNWLIAGSRGLWATSASLQDDDTLWYCMYMLQLFRRAVVAEQNRKGYKNFSKIKSFAYIHCLSRHCSVGVRDVSCAVELHYSIQL